MSIYIFYKGHMHVWSLLCYDFSVRLSDVCTIFYTFDLTFFLFFIVCLFTIDIYYWRFGALFSFVSARPPLLLTIAIWGGWKGMAVNGGVNICPLLLLGLLHIGQAAEWSTLEHAAAFACCPFFLSVEYLHGLSQENLYGMHPGFAPLLPSTPWDGSGVCGFRVGTLVGWCRACLGIEARHWMTLLLVLPGRASPRDLQHLRHDSKMARQMPADCYPADVVIEESSAAAHTCPDYSAGEPMMAFCPLFVPSPSCLLSCTLVILI